MLDTVIFDMDGVLVDSEPVYFARQLRFMVECGVTPKTTNIQDYVGRPSDVVWARAIPDVADRQKVLQAYLDFEAHTPIDFGAIVTPGIPEFLEYLKVHNYKTAIASAGAAANIELMLQQTGLASYFDSVISGETIAHNKPHPDVYLQSLAALSAQPQNAVAIEDSFTGITAAHRAGMQAWAVQPTQYTLDQQEAEFVTQHVADFSKRLEQQI